MTAKKWDADNISDQSGRVAIVTGASSGIGYETARVLANKNATVIIAVRNRKKGTAAIDKIKARNPAAKLVLMDLDLANLKSVKDFADRFKNDYKQLDLLINNAGVMIPPYTKTADGFELQIGTNHLGHFALTGHLLALLQQTPDSRVVNVSSMAHKRGNINFEDINWEKRRYNAVKAYGDSKIANLHFTSGLVNKLQPNKDNPIVAAAHPGWTATDLQRHSSLVEYLNKFFSQDITMGALPTLYAAVADDVENDDYIGPSGFMEIKGYPKKVGRIKRAQNDQIAEKLWDVSEKLTGVRY